MNQQALQEICTEFLKRECKSQQEWRDALQEICTEFLKRECKSQQEWRDALQEICNEFLKRECKSQQEWSDIYASVQSFQKNQDKQRIRKWRWQLICNIRSLTNRLEYLLISMSLFCLWQCLHILSFRDIPIQSC